MIIKLILGTNQIKKKKLNKSQNLRKRISDAIQKEVPYLQQLLIMRDSKAWRNNIRLDSIDDIGKYYEEKREGSDLDGERLRGRNGFPG